MNIIDYDLLSIQEARILAENAHEAQQTLATFPQEKLDEITERMAEEIAKHAKELAVMSSEETDYGIWQDKYIKNRFACEYLPTKLRGMRCVGIIKKDEEKQMMDVGVPVGVIASLVPATSPVSTTIYTALVAIKAGNAVIFSPHPRAKETIGKTLDILIQAAEGYGLPEGALTYLHTVTPAGTIELMNHRCTSLVMDTGVPGMLDAAYQSGKPVIYGGTGNGPAFIERTADIRQAVSDIIASKTFDNGVVSAAEQSIVVDSCIAGEVRQELVAGGAYFMTDEEADLLGRMFYYPDGSSNPELVGKTAAELAKRAGFAVPNGTRVLISQQKYVSENNPYSREKLCPVLAYYIEDDWMHACEKCIELLLSERHGHTLVIHSKDPEVIRQFALKKPVGRMLVNTPAVFGSMGATTNLFPAMTLGSGSAGKGITSDNVSPMNLIYIRKVGYGVRQIEEIGLGIPQGSPAKAQSAENTGTNNDESLQVLQKILEEALKNLG
ncbi:aldehyde dehydrogenase family protein [Ihubacter massiliensis]|uniref:Aldehyde dehydrogenase family protein n=1 Tax=Hominibacterium faecale TaxID=2839743 RepID=A0A9J6QN28_9FIRM|nr:MULTISPECIES: aldehyde dehydrogenase family protein [Eubacteriales Family XIII. Incertae Sedis]MCC2864597.1 aldehyde dehydrogenase family protein [Anaerovorax odorimutans]MCI7303636.1 aldehyde dehydrogenase family protein [Clostridia bacterium]MDY3011188.1 aldehyde dehydrogenase family protein [Clostridiales Family XIII bacterium]MCO7123889.1 aldehyde dehydrogenase family protein [Ihubacter massiliensis]MCU7378816.1 aldehyde dehydrogenase family protein [Hominibacterium faecale]